MTTTGPAPAGFYRAAEVARLLRCSEWWVKEQARRRRIPFCWIGGSYLFTDEHIAAIVRLFEVQPDAGGQRRGVARAVSPPSGPEGELPLRARPPRRLHEHNRGHSAA
ncbi:helix-turn-helix domain-containing protein [Mangrovihabitans endophyticus]|uniref:Helix-turn-helix domain-containing protein n=1 Tax=Mangrovihabitans endophyticus TaxID=1751298 RepID=A0A8J3FRU8_9ACTN|nr:helix-turn-helix domain-containing protein [Mangrovihabitans endophyticus]GGL09797.1 hypothetical protein GCM10012284_50650 [Mangrovihabitans endophyticus]